MKPESLKCLLNCYLREKITSSYDDVDGVRAVCAGEPIGNLYTKIGVFSDMYLEEAAPVIPQLQNVQLPPAAEEFARHFGRQLSQMSDEYEQSRSRSRSVDSQPDELGNKYVHFKTRCIFSSPNEDRVKIAVMRIGSADEIVKVKWETVDKTAKTGIHYFGGGGEISFAEGETEKTVEVEIAKIRRDKNIFFTVNLLDSEGIEIGPDNPLTVYIVDHSNFVPVERQVVENIMNCFPNASVSEIACCLHDELTVNTFRTALQYRCSFFDSVPQELAFAFELVKLSVGKANLETLGEVVCKFFSHVPELEDFME